jgi:hypothetical protein
MRILDLGRAAGASPWPARADPEFHIEIPE